MRRVLFHVIPLLFFVPALPACQDTKDKSKADKPATPAEQLESLQKQVAKAQQEAVLAFREAKSDAERQKIIDLLQKKPDAYAARFLALAEKNPKDPVAFGALSWIALNVQGGPELVKAIDTLLKDHLEKLGELSLAMASSQSPGAEKFLRSVAEKSAEPKVQGSATLALAQFLKSKSESPELKPDDVKKLMKEAEDLFDKVVQKFAAVENLAELAKRELFEIRNLAIGKTAPEISGEDRDGQKFKLSDYRGKVVVLDFWAGW